MKMTKGFAVTAVLLGLAPVTIAQVDTGGRPKDATALCKDGTFYAGTDRATACSRNGGIQEWWGPVVAPKDVPDSRRAPKTAPRPPRDERAP